MNIDLSSFKHSLLGVGKSGYSYLIEKNLAKYVLKKIHYNHCPYYHFDGNKTELEIRAYERLKNLNILIPKLYYYDFDKNFIVKEYVKGKTVAQEICENTLSRNIWIQILRLSEHLKKNRINIDYFPTNFVISNANLYYIDYELNPYERKWDFLNWGIHYWLNQKGMTRFLKSGDHSFLNRNNRGMPYTQPIPCRINRLKKTLNIR